jgi:hypothetical protein
MGMDRLWRPPNRGTGRCSLRDAKIGLAEPDVKGPLRFRGPRQRSLPAGLDPEPAGSRRKLWRLLSRAADPDAARTVAKPDQRQGAAPLALRCLRAPQLGSQAFLRPAQRPRSHALRILRKPGLRPDGPGRLTAPPKRCPERRQGSWVDRKVAERPVKAASRRHPILQPATAVGSVGRVPAAQAVPISPGPEGPRAPGRALSTPRGASRAPEGSGRPWRAAS